MLGLFRKNELWWLQMQHPKVQIAIDAFFDLDTLVCFTFKVHLQSAVMEYLRLLSFPANIGIN
jgi:hypothetical protein